MNILIPFDVTDAMLSSSTIAEPSAAAGSGLKAQASISTAPPKGSEAMPVGAAAGGGRWHVGTVEHHADAGDLDCLALHVSGHGDVAEGQRTDNSKVGTAAVPRLSILIAHRGSIENTPRIHPWTTLASRRR